MTSEVEMRAALSRGQHAKRIIEDELVNEAIAGLRSDAYAKIEATKPSQKDEREFLYQRLQAINGFEAQFTFHIENGRMARGILDEYRAKKAVEGRRRRT